MVSIAESFYYRIFERKWRMGEAFRGPSPCMPYSVSNKQKKPLNKGFRSDCEFSLLKQEPELRRGTYPWCAAVWLGVCCAMFPFAGGRRFLAARLAQPNVFQKKHCVFSLRSTILILFTDLSMAGLPAELKHITQRRKRKQP